MPSELLGCGIPRVFIGEHGGQNVLSELRPSHVSYSRRLDEISDMRVTFSAPQKPECVAVLQDLDGFTHEITVYRDQDEAWVGPVTEPNYTYLGGSIAARDLFEWFERRTLPYDRGFVNTDLSSIAVIFLNDALEIDPSPNISIVASPCGVLGDRNIRGFTFRRCADEVRELARSGLDFTAYRRQILFGGREIVTANLPTLTEDIFEIGTVRMAGLEKANRTIVLGATPPGVTTPLVGTAGGNELPVVELTYMEPAIFDVPSAQAAAQTRLDLFRTAPFYISGRFLPEAPISFNSLIPGAIAQIRQQVGFRRVDGLFRLLSVGVEADVSDRGITETVGGVFTPAGTIEGGA